MIALAVLLMFIGFVFIFFAFIFVDDSDGFSLVLLAPAAFAIIASFMIVDSESDISVLEEEYKIEITSLSNNSDEVEYRKGDAVCTATRWEKDDMVLVDEKCDEPSKEIERGTNGD